MRPKATISRALITLSTLSTFVLLAPAITSAAPPLSTITAPEAGAKINSTVSIEVSYLRPVRLIKIYIDGELYDQLEIVTYIGKYTSYWNTGSFADGPHILYAYTYVTPVGGLGQCSNIVNVVVDNTSPTIGDFTPPPGSFATDYRPEIAATILGAASGVDPQSISMKLDGDAVQQFSFDPETARVSHVPDSDLSESSHTAWIYAESEVGWSAETSWSFNLDATPPVIAITSPENDSLTNQSTASVTGTVDDGTAVVTVNGLEVTLFLDTHWQFSTEISLQEGQNVIRATATDEAGNSLSKIVQVTRDSTLPSVTIYSPLDGGTVVNPSVSVSGAVDDVTCTITVNGISATIDPGDGSFIAEGVALSEGSNEIIATAEDAAFNVGTDSVTVILDSTAPVIAISSPPSGTVTGVASIVVTGTIDDGTATVLVNDIAALIEFGTFTASGIALREGSNLILAEATDPAGNLGISQITVNLDTTPPAVTITSPPDEFVTKDTSVTVTGTVDDSSATLTVNGEPVTISGGSFNILVSLSEGENAIFAQATDTVGNVGSAGITVTLDTETPDPPVLDAFSELTDTTRVEISGTAEAGAAILVSGGAAPASGRAEAESPYAFNVVVFLNPNVQNNLSVTVTDAAGNTSDPSTASITHDEIPPALTVLAPEEGANFSVLNVDPPASIPVTVTGTVSDTHGIASLLIDGNQVAVQDGSFQTTVELPVPGEVGTVPHTISVVATDSAGNEGTLNRGVTAELVVQDEEPPVVTITSPQEGEFFNQTGITLAGTVTDASEISVLQYEINGGGTVDLPTGSSFDTTITLSQEDANAITVFATDTGGYEGSDTVTVTLDTEPPDPPVVNTVNPPSPTNSRQVNVMGTYDPGFTVRVTGDVSDAESVVSGSGTYSVTVPLTADSQNILHIYGIDQAGNVSFSYLTEIVEQDSVPPFVFSVDPPAGATGVPLTAWVTLTFSEAMDTETLSPESIWLEGNGSVISSSFSMLTGNDAVRLTPTESLADSLLIKVKVAPAVADLAGNHLASTFTSTFTTIDLTPPAAVILSPPPPQFTNSDFIRLTGTAEAGSEVWVNWDNQTDHVSADGESGAFSMEVALDLNQENELNIRAIDAAGNNGPVTAVTITHDNISPYVQSVDPTYDSHDIALDKIVKITFSEDLASSSVPSSNQSGGNIEITDETGIISGNFSLNGELVTFTPAPEFSDSARVTVTVTTGIRDKAGNFAIQTSGDFYVVDNTSPDPPVVTDISPPSPTNATWVTLTGTAEAGSEVHVGWDDHTDRVTADGTTGEFSVGVSPLTPDEVNVISLKAVDVSGNESQTTEILVTQDSTYPQRSKQTATLNIFPSRTVFKNPLRVFNFWSF